MKVIEAGHAEELPQPTMEIQVRGDSPDTLPEIHTSFLSGNSRSKEPRPTRAGLNASLFTDCVVEATAPQKEPAAQAD